MYKELTLDNGDQVSLLQISPSNQTVCVQYVTCVMLVVVNFDSLAANIGLKSSVFVRKSGQSDGHVSGVMQQF